MGKIRRGGYVFLTWKGDHGPYHVHVYRDGEFIVKWDLESDTPIRGSATQRIRRLLKELREESAL